ncbi:MAG TPA: hypothetical protein VF506_04165, partial [Streptosporangiaceae bacterium]
MTPFELNFAPAAPDVPDSRADTGPAVVVQARAAIPDFIFIASHGGFAAACRLPARGRLESQGRYAGDAELDVDGRAGD